MSVKNKTNNTLLRYYSENGFESTVRVAYSMLGSKTYSGKGNFHSELHGEICESVLEISILEYIRTHSTKCKNWFYRKGLILKDVENPDSKFLTECDLVLFTPQRILIFECKSYNIEKVIEDKCTIKCKNGKQFNVFNQNYLHYKVLIKQFGKFSLVNCITNTMCHIYLFDFSNGKTTDNRDKKYKLLMPHVTVNNIFSILESLNGPSRWDLSYCKRAVDIIDSKKDENTIKHLQYVKDLNNRR